MLDDDEIKDYWFRQARDVQGYEEDDDDDETQTKIDFI